MVRNDRMYYLVKSDRATFIVQDNDSRPSISIGFDIWEYMLHCHDTTDYTIKEILPINAATMQHEQGTKIINIADLKRQLRKR